jgi:alcohol dehydrogenase
MEILSIGGIAVWIGSTFPQRDIKVNAEKLVRNLHTIKGLHNYTNHDLINAVNFVESHFHEFPFDEMIEAEFTLDRVNEAFRYAVENNPYRVGITFNHSK